MLGSLSAVSPSGHLRRGRCSQKSAIRRCCPKADKRGLALFVGYVPILLQKSEIEERSFSRQKTRQVKIADRCGLNLISEVACEFVTVR